MLSFKSHRLTNYMMKISHLVKNYLNVFSLAVTCLPK